jgi:hypothetical protein
MYYGLYQGKKKLKDENGNFTDEIQSYSYPEEFRANLSPNKGESSSEPFGINLDYTRTLCTNEKLPLDEHSVIWFETEPPISESDGQTADYDVVARATSKNYTLYALRKRTKNGT